jgi:hypothetical protein
MKFFKNVYEVTIKATDDPTAPALLAGVDLGEDGYAEPVDTDEHGNQIIAVYTDHNIDRHFDTNDDVISYTVTDSVGN